MALTDRKAPVPEPAMSRKAPAPELAYNRGIRSLPIPKPAYGAETQANSPQQAISGLLNAIDQSRKEMPVYMPFPGGTPTGAGRAAAESRSSTFGSIGNEKDAGILGLPIGTPTAAQNQFTKNLAQSQNQFSAQQGQRQNEFERQQRLREEQFGFNQEQAEGQTIAEGATNKAVSDVLTAPTKEDAYNVLNASMRSGEFAGADMNAVIRAIESKYGSAQPGLEELLMMKLMEGTQGQ